MNILTLKELEKMSPGIFAKGETVDSLDGVNIANTGKTIKWVAVRGDYHDWAIYTDNPYMPQGSFESVADVGDKITGKDNILKLVPCEKEAFEMYRY